ncbi:hypothetical protein CspeluHIS016_0501160 [Cutaneotrichosporon spelunceum]|uniref:Uncharacterized protein n=1 Tax=Cutaneotrichosporon spelunceum TaxID=1672016 RepID=A0AAD3TX27_9TREE|nr:hypothetical protein CspeluHIS016_0501160 [Cutaneotrichosporon spelunceum]
MAILETTAEQLANPAAGQRRSSLAALKDKLAGHGDHSHSHSHSHSHEAKADEAAQDQGQEKEHGHGHEGHAHPHYTAQPTSPARRGSLALVHDKLTFYHEAPKDGELPKPNVRETTADEMFNPPPQGRRSSFVQMFTGRK